MKQSFFCILAFIAVLFVTNTATAQTTDSVKKVTIKVINLHCNNDMPTIKKNLLNQEGIDEVTFTDISRETSVFTITYHTSVTGQEQIEKTVESTPGCDDKKVTPYRVKKEGSRKRSGS